MQLSPCLEAYCLPISQYPFRHLFNATLLSTQVNQPVPAMKRTIQIHIHGFFPFSSELILFRNFLFLTFGTDTSGTAASVSYESRTSIPLTCYTH